jgi:hypothetical protein
MTVHFSEGHFEIIVIQNQKLLFNSFDYQTPDFYYVLFTAEQLSLNWKLSLELIGNIDMREFFLK